MVVAADGAPARAAGGRTMEPTADPIDPDMLATLVQHQRRFLRFLEPRVGSRAVADRDAGAAGAAHPALY